MDDPETVFSKKSLPGVERDQRKLWALGASSSLTDNLMEVFFEKGSFTGGSLVLRGEEEQEVQ